MMKRALIGGLSVLAMIVGVSAASAQANKRASGTEPRETTSGTAHPARISAAICASPTSIPCAVTATRRRVRPPRLRPPLRYGTRKKRRWHRANQAL